MLNSVSSSGQNAFASIHSEPVADYRASLIGTYSADGSGAGYFAINQFLPNSSATQERRRIATTGAATFGGNVSVNGATSPNSSLAILSDSGANAVEIRTRATSNDYAFINFNSTDASEALGAIGVHRTAAATASLIFYSNDGTAGVNEVGRFDASGNLLVGTTSTIPYTFSSGTGAGITSTGTVMAGATAEAALFNRIGSDGSIVNFYKAGTIVGSIGTNGGVPYLSGPLAGGIKLSYYDATYGLIFPVTTTGAIADGTHDLGYSAARFRDFYLSGGVYLGGTGAANLLDDYEEGTWTPTHSGMNAVGAVTVSGTYTKVGRKVHITGKISAVTSLAPVYDGGSRFQSLPFTGASCVANWCVANAVTVADSTFCDGTTNIYAPSVSVGAGVDLIMNMTLEV